MRQHDLRLKKILSTVIQLLIDVRLSNYLHPNTQDISECLYNIFLNILYTILLSVLILFRSSTQSTCTFSSPMKVFLLFEIAIMVPLCNHMSPIVQSTLNACGWLPPILQLGYTLLYCQLTFKCICPNIPKHYK